MPPPSVDALRYRESPSPARREGTEGAAERVLLFPLAGDQPEFVMEQLFHEFVPPGLGMHYLVKITAKFQGVAGVNPGG